MSSLASFSCSGLEARHLGAAAAELNARLGSGAAEQRLGLRKRRETIGVEPRSLREEEEGERDSLAEAGRRRDVVAAVASAAAPLKATEAMAVVEE